MDPQIKERVEQIAQLMDPVIEDTTVPRNIRRAVSDAKDRILGLDGDVDVNVASAIYTLDEISNDINMPFHVRTEIWNIVSELEHLKEEVKK